MNSRIINGTGLSLEVLDEDFYDEEHIVFVENNYTYKVSLIKINESSYKKTLQDKTYTSAFASNKVLARYPSMFDTKTCITPHEFDLFFQSKQEYSKFTPSQYNPPVPFNKTTFIEKNDKGITSLREQYSNFSIGCPIRCINKKDYVYFDKIHQIHSNLRTFLKTDMSKFMRPVTYIYEGVPIKPYRTDSTIILLDPNLIQPERVYKSNYFTFRLANTNLQKHFTNENINESFNTDRNYPNNTVKRIGRKGVASRLPKPMLNVQALGKKMEEYAEWPSSLLPSKTSGHLEWDDTHKCLFEKEGKALPYVEFDQRCISHNEVLCHALLPKMVTGTCHYLAPEHFSANNSIYAHLGMRLYQHFQLEKMLVKMNKASTNKLLFITYNAQRGAITEINEPSLMLTDTLKESLLNSDSIITTVQQWGSYFQTKCKQLNLHWDTLQKIVSYAPLKRQLLFLEKQFVLKEEFNEDCFLKNLYEDVFYPSITIFQPQNIAETIQQLIQHLYLCPATPEELSECLKKRLIPLQLATRVSPAEACASAICCYWMCELLSTVNLIFSVEEKLILSYVIIIMRTNLSAEKIQNKIDSLFTEGFAYELITRIKQALQVNNESNDDKVLQYRMVLTFSKNFIDLSCKIENQISNELFYSELISCDPILSKMIKNQLFSMRLNSTMNSMIDIMILNGLVNEVNDKRAKMVSPLEQFCLNASVLSSRKLKIDLNANVWRYFQTEISDYCRRKLVFLANHPQPNISILRNIPLPFSMTLLDMLCITLREQEEALSDIISFLRTNSPSLPIHLLSKESADKLKCTPELSKAITEHPKKMIPFKLLINYRSPTITTPN